MGRRRIVVDQNTGEIITPAKIERFAKKKQGAWRKAYEKKVFTLAEERVINRLAEYLEMNTNAIIKPGGGRVGLDEMAKIVHMDRSNFRKTVQALIKKNAIGKFDSYYMNPCLYEMGNVSSLLYHQFREKYDLECGKTTWGKRTYLIS
jgi:hypothetical protein